MSERLVIAEDDDDIRANLSRLLRLEGYDVQAAPNGRLALELVRSQRPDLVLSDVMMPEMTGHELLQALRADPATADIPVVLLTARADRKDVREGMNIGADDYLTKPFQRDEVLECIRSRLDRQATQRQATQRLAEQSHHLAHHDSVTDLPNRGHFLLRLAAVLSPVRAQPPLMWHIGLDSLAEMTQILSAQRLDEAVRALAQRLREWLQAQRPMPEGPWLLARTAEDRFTVLLSDSQSEDDAHGQALLEVLSQPLQIGDERHFPRFSLVALRLDDDGAPAQSALGRAEIALAQVRQGAGLRFAAHSLKAMVDVGTTFRLHNDLHLAVERGELRALFQPQIDARTHQVCGFEALMRWQHPTLGLVSPARFIPLAEDNGQIVGMGQWMLQQACACAAEWHRAGLFEGQPVRMAVNLSLRQFVDPHIHQHVAQALATSGLDPAQLELEITEGTAMLDLGRTLRLLNQFKDMGVQLALDDFGTGYSSLAYLKRFPLDVLKIDQSFVRHIGQDAEDRAIAHAVASLARALGMRVIAEGVETQEQERVLVELGCDEIQGYLHGKPMPAADVPGWVQAHRARHAAVRN